MGVQDVNVWDLRQRKMLRGRKAADLCSTDSSRACLTDPTDASQKHNRYGLSPMPESGWPPALLDVPIYMPQLQLLDITPLSPPLGSSKHQRQRQLPDDLTTGRSTSSGLAISSTLGCSAFEHSQSVSNSTVLYPQANPSPYTSQTKKHLRALQRLDPARSTTPPLSR